MVWVAFVRPRLSRRAWAGWRGLPSLRRFKNIDLWQTLIASEPRYIIRLY
jgi:hypothetical protein